MKWDFFYEITDAFRTPDCGATAPRSPFSVLCPQLNLLNPPPEKNSWVRHWSNVRTCGHGEAVSEGRMYLV
jgi:hypothetical protein